MNEIEKLYENAGVEKQYYSFKSACGKTYNWELNENGNDKYNMRFIGKPEIKERSFTAEKQLELIKWLIREKYLIGRYIESYYELFTNSMISYNSKNECFKRSLAGLINNLWQDITEEEKEQIRGILNANI